MDLGLCLADFDVMEIGMIVDLLVEKANENSRPRKTYATQDDINAF